MTVTQADLDAAKADILAKVNDRFTALGKLVIPDPPPVAQPTIKFASHRYWLSGPKQPADFYDFQDGPSWVRSDFPASAQTFRYATTARSVSDSGGYRQLVPTTVSSAYLAKQPSGAVVSRVANGDQLLDISSSLLLNAVQSWLLSITSKFDGLYLDEVDDTWRYGYPSATTTLQWANDTEWQASMATFVQGTSQKLHTLGKKLWVNLGSSLPSTNSFIQRIVAAADAVNIEYFVGRDKLGMIPAHGFDLAILLDRLSWVERAGKPVHAHVSTTNQTLVDKGFYAWLLGTEFLGSFTASLDYGGDFLLPTANILANARKLGVPLGTWGLTVPGGYIAQRSFQNGMVSLNMNDLTGSITLRTP